MTWLFNFLTSSIGRKLLMSLTGLFLITFLPVHLAGNFLLLAGDGGEAFNMYADFMTSNPLIKFLSYGLYFFILAHTVLGIYLWRKNKAARGSRYAVEKTRATQTNAGLAKNMAAIGTIILVFILVHMYQFWFKMKLGVLPTVTYGEAEVSNLYLPVLEAFTNFWFVLFYVASMIVIGFHLKHGFQSAFQTLGLNHKKYTPIIQTLGTAYSILIPLGFAIIPIWMYLVNS